MCQTTIEHYIEGAAVFTILRKSTYLHDRSKVWRRYFFVDKKEMNTFIQRGHIKLIRTTVKTYDVTKDLYIF